jgi:hypothetical protein
MTFTTPTFLIFLVVVGASTWCLSRRWQNHLLVVASLVFYGWWDAPGSPFCCCSPHCRILGRARTPIQRRRSVARADGQLGLVKLRQVPPRPEGGRQLARSLASPLTPRDCGPQPAPATPNQVAPPRHRSRMSLDQRLRRRRVVRRSSIVADAGTPLCVNVIASPAVSGSSTRP